jgi:hypothetical protein
MNAHEDIVLLRSVSKSLVHSLGVVIACLLIPDRELALSLLVRLRKLIQLLDSIIVKHLLSKPNVTLGVLMTRIDFSIIGKCRKRLVQGFVHLSRVTLEEAAATSDEERVASEDSLVGAVFEEEGDAVLGMAGCVERSHFNITDVELRLVFWSGCDLSAVLAADDREFELFELFWLGGSRT